MGFCVFSVCMILLEPVGIYSLDVAILLLPAEVNAATRGLYLALSKS